MSMDNDENMCASTVGLVYDSLSIPKLEINLQNICLGFFHILYYDQSS